MVGIREFNHKILNLKNTLKITTSMKLISSVKLQQYMGIKQANALFFKQASKVIKNLGSCGFLENGKPSESKSKSVLIFLFSGNRGLCGRFNSNIIKEAFTLYTKKTESSAKCTFYFAGNKGYTFCKKKNLDIGKLYQIQKPDFKTAQTIADDLIDAYKSNSFQEIWLVYTKNKSKYTPEPFSEQLLPLSEKYTCSEEEIGAEYIIEEPKKDIENVAIRFHTSARVYKAMIESAISEHYSRLDAMDAASTNCNHLIENYTQLRNRARQSSITSELSEIISGKESLEN